MISEAYGNGKFQIKLDAHLTDGNGLMIIIMGGELPHLGGVALASPGVVLHNKVLSHCDMWTMTVPGHKDVELAQTIAKKICIATGEPVMVSLGVHVDDASAEEIRTLCDNCMRVTDLFLDKYLKMKSRVENNNE